MNNFINLLSRALFMSTPLILGAVGEVISERAGMMMCADLLRANAERGGIKKQHCDKMVYEAIEILERLLDGQEQ